MARPSRSSALPLTYVSELPRAEFLPDAVPGAAGVVESPVGGLLLDGAGASAALALPRHQGPEYSGHASVQTSGFSRNRGKGGWARDLRAELFAAV